MKIKIGIIGCGAVGSALAKIILKEFSRQATLAYLAEHHQEKIVQFLKKTAARPKLVSPNELIQKSDFIIEAASKHISAQVARKALARGKQVMILSVGGLLESGRDWAKSTKGKLWIPSGAIAGIDGLLAAREAGLKRVSLVTRKPPEGLLGAPYFQKRKFPKLTANQEKRVFRGNATQAVKAFPQNVNVAAILSLAGFGPLRTQVEIWTSRRYRQNIHEIQIESRAGRMQFRIQNVPSRLNPKTSHLAICSAVAMLRKIFSSRQIGT